MSGFFKRINGVDVDLTTLFQAEGSGNAFFTGLDITSTKKDYRTAYARPTDFGYKIKDSNNNITDLSEYCDSVPIICNWNPNNYGWDTITWQNITNYNQMSGYIAGGSGSGGGGGGGAYDTNWGDKEVGGYGTGGKYGDLHWFEIDISNYTQAKFIIGRGGRVGVDIGGGSNETSKRGETSNLTSYGGGRYRDTGGSAGQGRRGESGKKTTMKLYAGNAVIHEAVAAGGTYGDGGNYANTNNKGSPSNGNVVNAKAGSTSYSDNWNPLYNKEPLSTPSYGTNGSKGGDRGNTGSNTAHTGGTGTAGEPGFAVLYLKR
jgi:hypothetical protein